MSWYLAALGAWLVASAVLAPVVGHAVHKLNPTDEN